MSFFKHLKKLAESGILPTEKDVFVYADNNKLYLSKAGKSLSALSKEDFSVIDINCLQKLSDKEEKILELFDAYADKRALIICYPTNAATLAKSKQSLPPILDDMAQVVGLSLKYVDKDCRYAQNLKWRNCLLLSDGGLIALGRTVEEAVTATLVAEKSAMCYLESKKLGGAKRINFVRSILMFMIYKNKYSKENIKRQRSSNND